MKAGGDIQMIRISKPWKENREGYTYAKVKVTMDRETCHKYLDYCNLPENKRFTKYIDETYADLTCGETVLWFSVGEKFKDALCLDRADAFLVSMLHYAMAAGADIYSEAPVSSMLLYNIRTEIIPHLCTGKFKPIKIEADPIDTPYPTHDCAATGMSCGIDSFFTLWLHEQEGIPDNFKIKYLTFFNVGAINGIFSEGVPLERRNELMLQVSREKAAQAQAVADACGMELVFVNSNISDYYRGMFVNSAHYRNCGTAMLLSGLWNKYYYSSAGFEPANVKFKLTDDPAYYEESLLPWLSNGIIRLYSAGHGYPRVAKTRKLADYPLAQEYLNVCDRDENCGKCGKCQRTICTLIALDKLDGFGKRFDVEQIKKNEPEYKRKIFLKRKQNYYNGIFAEADKNHLFTSRDKIVYGLESIPYELIRNNGLYRSIRNKKYAKNVKNVQ